MYILLENYLEPPNFYFRKAEALEYKIVAVAMFILHNNCTAIDRRQFFFLGKDIKI